MAINLLAFPVDAHYLNQLTEIREDYMSPSTSRSE